MTDVKVTVNDANRQFVIDVGNLPPEKVMEFINNVKKSFSDAEQQFESKESGEKTFLAESK